MRVIKISNTEQEMEEWLKNCHFCHKPIDYKMVYLSGAAVVGSFDKKTVYHQECYESIVLNFGNEKQRQDYFKMMED